KNFLLGTAAGLVVVTAGQAAELPVKAKPVAYVKVCTLYGAGFYYMPGTDMCIKIGGWTRAEVTDIANGNLATGPFANNSNSRVTNNLTVRARGYITADAREETPYGVARAYIDVGLSTSTVGADNASNTFSSNRAFLQWAGFTAGLTRSFYDFFNAAVQNYRAGYLPQEDTGDAGWWLWAYTAQLGGGLSATISAEGRRTTQIIGQFGGTDVGEGTLVAGVGSLGGYGGWNVPDIVGNIRIDQAWGSAQIMAAGHELNPLYYGTLQSSGHPGDTFGFAVGAGAHLNTSFISPGDYIEGEFNYAQGAQQYLADSTRTNMQFATGGTQSFGIQSDCVYGSAAVTGVAPAELTTGCEQTTGWSAILSYEHYWTPQWHQSFTGAYMQTNYGSTANDILCTLEGQGTGSGSEARAEAGCNNNWNYWGAGSRLQWDVTKSFYLGVEALYLQQDTASSATGLVPTAAALGAPTLCALTVAEGGGCTNSDEHTWVFTIRMHKDFLP
ncbi:MAG TPA: porin, partial [Telluria sp.]